MSHKDTKCELIDVFPVLLMRPQQQLQAHDNDRIVAKINLRQLYCTVGDVFQYLLSGLGSLHTELHLEFRICRHSSLYSCALLLPCYTGLMTRLLP